MKLSGLAFVSMLLVVGCGGGNPGTEALSEQTMTGGNITIRGSRLAQPQLAQGQRATVYAMTGNISSAVQTDPTPTIEETQIAYVLSGNGGDTLMTCHPDGTATKVITTVPNNPINGAGLIKFLPPNSTYIYYLDGTDLKRISNIGFGGSSTLLKSGVKSFAFTPSGNTLLYLQTDNKLYWSSLTATGGTLVHDFALDGFDEVAVIGCVTDSKAVMEISPNGDPNNYLNRVDLGTGIVLNISTTPVHTVSIRPDGRNIEWVSNSAGVYKRHRSTVDPMQTITLGTISPSSDASNISQIAVAPDSSVLLGAQYNNLNTQVGLRFIDQPYTLGSFLVEGFTQIMNWGPMVKSRTFVGAGTAPGAAAVLFAEAGPVFRSVVVADATTRASMTATEVSGPSAANVVFRLDCDQLSRLYYTDDNSFRYRTVVGAAGSLKGAFVSFDASTGSVDSIVTFTKRPQAKWQAGRLMLTGGENLAVAMPVTGSTRQPSIVVE